MGLITQPSEIKQETLIKGLIYGQPGIGKSTLAASAPNPVCIDADRGMHRVEAQYRIPTLEVKNYAQVLELLNSNEIDDYKTIVFDTIGELITMIDPHIISGNPKLGKRDKSLTLQGYGVRKTEFKRLLTLVASKRKNVIFIAHEKEERIGDDRIVRPDIQGSSGADIIKLLDFVGYMQAIGEKRTIQFSPTEKFYAKNSLGLDNYIELNHTRNGNIFISENIVKATEIRLKEEAKIRENYNELIAKCKIIIEDSEDLNNAILEIKAFAPIWDSHIKFRSMISVSAKDRGVIFNKKTKKYDTPKAEPVKKAEAKND